MNTIDNQNKKIAELTALLDDKEQLINQLQSENSIYKSILALIPGNVFWKDIHRRYLGANNNVVTLLGCTHLDEIIGKTNDDLMPHMVDIHTLEESDRSILVSGEERYFEERGVDLQGNPAIYLSKKAPLRDEQGLVIGMIGVSFDITERKKMEEEIKIGKEKAEESSRAKSQFLAVVNHELRTPLTGIIGLIDILKRNQLTAEEQAQSLEDLKNCSDYLLSLINDLLDFSKIESGKIKIDLEPVDLRSLICETLSLMTGLAKNKEIELKINLTNDIPKHILADRYILQQILINIINNAIKFTDRGRVEVSTAVLRRSYSNVTLALNVSDTGRGIPKDKLNLIFEPFQQLENSYVRSSSRNGIGFGLAIVRELAELLKAEIKVSSEIGVGSLFSFIADFELADHVYHSNENHRLLMSSSCVESEMNVKNRKNRIKVLLVEDDPIVQLVHKSMLMQLNCDVEVTDNGRKALKLLNQQDIIFVDLGLPDMDGFELIKTIRAHSKHSQHFIRVPIIALTGFAGKVEALACLNAGANKTINKPVSLNVLQEILMTYVIQDLELSA